jgi:WD40 repeat protein
MIWNMTTMKSIYRQMIFMWTQFGSGVKKIANSKGILRTLVVRQAGFVTVLLLFSISTCLFGYTSEQVRAQSVSDEIRAREWNSQGTTLAVGGVLNGEIGVHLFNLNGEHVDFLPTSSRVLSVSWSPNDTRIATFTTEQRITIWDVATRTVLIEFEEDLSAKDDLSIYWSPNASSNAIATQFVPGVALYDIVSGNRQTLLSLPLPIQSVSTLSWNDDGSKIYTTSYDDIIRVWDVLTGTVVHERKVDGAESLELSTDGNYLAVGGWFNTVTILDVTTLDTVNLLEGVSGVETQFVAVRWSSDNSQLAASGFERIVVWDVGTLEITETIPLPSPITSVNPQAFDYGPQGSLTYVGDNNNLVQRPSGYNG